MNAKPSVTIHLFDSPKTLRLKFNKLFNLLGTLNIKQMIGNISKRVKYVHSLCG